MIGGISTLNVPSTMPANHLPKHLNVGCRATPGVSYPTHLLAVCASKSGDAHAKLVPTHALVLAAHCAHLPALPPSRPSGRATGLRVRTITARRTSPRRTFVVAAACPSATETGRARLTTHTISSPTPPQPLLTFCLSTLTHSTRSAPELSMTFGDFHCFRLEWAVLHRLAHIKRALQANHSPEWSV